MSQLARIFWIHEQINQKRKVKTQEVIDEFGVTRRMVINDINFMKDQLLVPIEYSPRDEGYIYTKPFTMLSHADEEMLLSYSFIRSLTEKYNYVPFLSEALLKNIQSFFSKEYRNLSDKIVYQLSNNETIDRDKFKLLVQSFIRKKKLEIHYSNQKNQESTKIIEPQKIINYQGIWYLVAWSDEACELRVFKILRIRSITLLNDTFKQNISPQRIENYLSKSYGIYLGNTSDGNDVKTATIRYYGKAMLIESEYDYHPSQTKTTGSDSLRGDYLEITLPVVNFDELKGKVLQYGEMAEVKSPPEFRESWLESIRKMSEWYLGE